MNEGPSRGRVLNGSEGALRIPELDGIRGTAIAMVLFYHYFQLTTLTAPRTPVAYLMAAGRLSWTGVDLFFVLSGFLIGGILLDARESRNYFKTFYTRRFFRIVPIYAVVLLCCLLAPVFASAIPGGEFSWLKAGPLPTFSYWTFTQNFWMARLGTLGPNGLAVTWSLAIEEQFYLTLPLLVRFLTRTQLTKVLVGGILFAPLLRLLLHFIWPHNGVAPFVLMPCRADALLLGVLVAILLREPAWKQWLLERRRTLGFSSLIPLFGMLWLTRNAGSFDNPLMSGVGYTWVGLFYASLLFCVLTYGAATLGRLFRMKWLAWLGSIAYGTYLLHQGVQEILYGYFWGHWPEISGGRTFVTTIAALLVTVVVARLSWQYFEKPLIRFGHRAKYGESEVKRELVREFAEPSGS